MGFLRPETEYLHPEYEELLYIFILDVFETFFSTYFFTFFINNDKSSGIGASKVNFSSVTGCLIESLYAWRACLPIDLYNTLNFFDTSDGYGAAEELLGELNYYLSK